MSNRQQRRRGKTANREGVSTPHPDLGANGLDPRFIAAVDLVRRTGAQEFQVRYQDDEQPVVWVAVARHRKLDGVPVPADAPGEDHWEAAGAIGPYLAVMRLAETLVDGGTCAHCARPAGVVDDPGPMPLADTVCWYQYDPEMKTFRRSCEGET